MFKLLRVSVAAYPASRRRVGLHGSSAERIEGNRSDAFQTFLALLVVDHGHVHFHENPRNFSGLHVPPAGKGDHTFHVLALVWNLDPLDVRVQLQRLIELHQGDVVGGVFPESSGKKCSEDR